MTAAEVQDKLKEKAAIYDSIVTGGKNQAKDASNKFMVDFEQKRWDHKSH